MLFIGVFSSTCSRHGVLLILSQNRNQLAKSQLKSKGEKFSDSGRLLMGYRGLTGSGVTGEIWLGDR
jgi:hypothetical protein